ncbi:MAG: hypothetical protein KGD61_04875, partial [Candidatus Lokiarchaeota archaeon]|nr:hypothetical protein [Candidatus Lokiarchaeota archaeon]
YVDETENPEIMLKKENEALFIRLGLANFLIENRGYYDSTVIMETYWGDKGRKVFEKYTSLVKSKICKFYTHLNESGVLDTLDEVYFFVLGLLMGNDVPRAIAACVAAIIAKQGVYSLCRNTQTGISSEE